MNEILNPKNDITVKAVFQEGDVCGSLTIDGVTYKVYLGDVGHTISEWSEILGIGKTTIRMRLESGWPDEDALTVPVRKRTRGYRPSSSCGAIMDLED